MVGTAGAELADAFVVAFGLVEEVLFGVVVFVGGGEVLVGES